MWSFKGIEELSNQRYPIMIGDLLDYPQAVESVVKWIHDEWAGLSGRTIEQTNARFRDGIERGKLPVTLIALHNGKPIGAGSLREKDSIDWYQGATPWICNVIVKEEARHKGVATALCMAFEQVATEMGFTAIYLATEYEDSLYHRIGYMTFYHKKYNEEIFFVTKLVLSQK